MSNQNPLGRLTAQQILDSIVLPDNVGYNHGSFRVRVFDRASRKAIGVVIWDQKKGASFKRTSEETTQAHSVDVTVLEGQYMLTIHLTDIEQPLIYASAKALLPNGTEESLPEGAVVTWYVRAEHDTGSVTERTYVKSPAENFELVDFTWVSGRLIVNVNYLDRVGALIVTKTGDTDLDNLILVAELEGLLIPDDFYDNIVW
jgi:hypothetical protein